MVYTPNTWETGDTINAAPLNTLEAGVRAAYDRSQHFGQQPAASVTGLSAVATSGNYTDLSGTPNLATVATTGAYGDLSGRPALSTVAQSGVYSDLTAKPSIVAGTGVAISTVGTVTTVSATSAGSTNDADFGAVLLDSFQTGGLSDDQLLSAAMTAVGADTYPRTIQLQNRLYAFTSGNITPYEGFRMRGTWGASNPERNSGQKVATPVSLTMVGPWFTSGSSTVFGCSFANLSLEGHGQKSVFIGSGTGTWDCLRIGDLYASGMSSIIGSTATKALLTASTFDGYWEINNSYDTFLHAGGSDNSFNWSTCLVDAAPAFAASDGVYHFWADSLDKTNVYNLYITAEAQWRAVKVSGSALNSGGTNQGHVMFYGSRLEGRNPSQPSHGSMVSITGGSAAFSGTWAAYGMSAPLGGENGFINHTGGQLTVRDVMYDATTQAQNTNTATPFLYTSGGAGLDVIVSGIKRGSRGSVSWGTNRPLVARATAGAENRIVDATVSQVTV